MSYTATASPATTSLDRLRAFGPRALIASGITALLVTAAAAFVDPRIAQPGATAYLYSGVVMTIVDALVLLGIAGLALSPALNPGWFKRLAMGAALVGSAGIVVAEPILRVDFATGNGVFAVVGPVQAVGFILAGIGIIRTATWSSWRRFVVLVAGLYVPAVVVPALAASGGTSLPALAGYHLLILATGVAFLTEERAPAR